MARIRRLGMFDLDAVGGLIAAILAVVLHLLDFIEQQALLVIMTSLLALLLFRDLREETATEELAQSVENTEQNVAEIRAAMAPSELELVGTDSLRQASQRFGQQARGDLIWFNICLLMLTRRETFDILVRPALENPVVSSLQFILDESQRNHWESTVEPVLTAVSDGSTAIDVYWRQIDESIASIHASSANGHSSALISFWGEPFMVETLERDVTRYILHVKERSELLPHLRDLARRYRLESA